jgi:pimeloyl-ACP methyl ester carboxylesterase
MWESPYFARSIRRLTDFARVILMDRRGTGLSDRFSPNDLPPTEDLADDILCVLRPSIAARCAQTQRRGVRGLPAD